MRWDIFAALVSLIGVPFMLSTTATTLASRLYRKIVFTLFPALGRCQRLEWQDLPEGVLHMCIPPGFPCISCPENCCHVELHEFLRICPHTSLTAFFRRGSHGNFVVKPHQLEIFEDYILVDTATLETFARYFLDVFPEEIVPYGNRIKFQEVNGVMTAWIIESEEMSCRVSSITKSEASKILKGYPPHYRETIRTHGGDIVPNPIKHKRDVDRGGWIVGVGMDALILELGFHEPSFPPWSRVKFSIEHVPGSPVFPRAIQRVFQGLHNIKKAFPSEECVDWAIELAEELSKTTRSTTLRPMRNSKLFDVGIGFHSGFSSRGWYRQQPQEDGLSSLTGAQCILAMDIFNTHEELTPHEVEELSSCLLPVLRCALIGIYVVKSWEEDHDIISRPALTLNKDCTHVFLRTRQGNVWE